MKILATAKVQVKELEVHSMRLVLTKVNGLNKATKSSSGIT